MNFIDIAIQNYFSISRSIGLTELMYIVSKVFDISIYSAIIFICFILLIYLFRGVRYSLLFAITIVSTGISVYALKTFFNIARPVGGVVVAFGQSFPSYHATIATVFFFMLIYVFDEYFSAISKTIFNAVCIVGVIVVSLSRVYLGVHWFSDVVFGVLLGLAISCVAVSIFKGSAQTL